MTPSLDHAATEPPPTGREVLGGVLLASCDAIGRMIVAPAEIPAGAITALIGGPYLVWLVRHRL